MKVMCINDSWNPTGGASKEDPTPAFLDVDEVINEEIQTDGRLFYELSRFPEYAYDSAAFVVVDENKDVIISEEIPETELINA
jgi:hypothetical protein